MISTYTIVLLNLVGIIEVFAPFVFILWLRRRHHFAISSLIAGLACYFIFNYVISAGVITVLRAAFGETFFTEHSFIALLIDSFLPALLTAPMFYLVTSTVRRGKWNIYDSLALGIGYWIVPRFLDAALQISSASILRQARNGNLSSLATEDYTEDMLNALVESITSTTGWQLTVDSVGLLIAQVCFLLVTMAIAVTVYYLVKRHRKPLLPALMGVHFVLLVIMNGSAMVVPDLVSLLIIILIGAGAGYYLYRFFRYYRGQQMELLRRKKEFKEEQHRKYMEELAAKQAKNEGR